MMARSNQIREVAAAVIAALVKGDRTSTEVAEMAGCIERTAHAWIQALHAAGLVREVRRPKRSKSAIWSWQRTPFEREDFAP